MKVIYTKRIPIGRKFYAINLFGVIFAKGKLHPITANHEYIHTLQQRELLFLFFYVWYVIEWLIKMIYYRDYYRGYRNISFEREAYANDHNLGYPRTRRWFAFLRYLVQR